MLPPWGTTRPCKQTGLLNFQVALAQIAPKRDEKNNYCRQIRSTVHLPGERGAPQPQHKLMRCEVYLMEPRPGTQPVLFKSKKFCRSPSNHKPHVFTLPHFRDSSVRTATVHLSAPSQSATPSHHRATCGNIRAPPWPVTVAHEPAHRTCLAQLH